MNAYVCIEQDSGSSCSETVAVYLTLAGAKRHWSHIPAEGWDTEPSARGFYHHRTGLLSGWYTPTIKVVPLGE